MGVSASAKETGGLATGLQKTSEMLAGHAASMKTSIDKLLVDN
jgi:hypothetical protein